MSPPSRDDAPTAQAGRPLHLPDHQHGPRRYRPSRRLLGAVVSLALVATAFYYDYAVLANVSATTPWWDLTRFDWVLVTCFTILFWLGVHPLLRRPDRARWYWRRLRDRPLAMAALAYLACFCVLAIVGPLLVERPVANLFRQYQPPVFTSVSEHVVGRCVGSVRNEMCYGTFQYPLGTNVMGYPVDYLIVKGARVSLLVALVAGTVVAPVATFVGVTAGSLGGVLDDVVMRYVDVQEAIPAFFVYIVAAFFLGKSLLLLLAVFGLLSWGGVARVVRGETLQRTAAGYVRAARAAGAGHLFVVRRHILPNVASTIVTATTQLIPGLLLAEIALGYLRLNDEVVRSWGWTLSFAISGKHGSFPVVKQLIPPSVAYPELHEKWAPLVFTVTVAALTVAAFAVLGDAMRDVLDPRTEVER